MAHATIQTASINTANAQRDKHLRSPDFFDAEKYPEISFKSTGAKKAGDRLMVTGDLTMHGITKSVVLPVEVLGVGTHPMSKAPVAGFTAELILKRSDFGVNNWTDVAGILGDEVKVTLNIEGVGGKMQNNPCAKDMKNPCNPCAKGMKNPCNPCAKGMENPCNPCAKGK
jgi:polyisoprenoid-binding protein YceI